MSYTFRLRFLTSDKIYLPFEVSIIPVYNYGNIRIYLTSYNIEASIKASNQLILLGEGFESNIEAEKAGETFRDRLTIAFSKLLFPADFGDGPSKSLVTEYGLKMLEQEIGSKLLNNIHGLQVYKSGEDYKFVEINMKAIIHKSAEETLKTIADAIASSNAIQEKMRLSFDLFSASILSDYADAKLMLLMMAVENLIEQGERRQEEQELIDKLIKHVKISNLSNMESMVSGLNALRQESIGQAGKRLALTLKNNKYMDLSPEKFFNYCYSLRSKIVHGHIPRPTREEIGTACGYLVQFTADLISSSD